MPPDKFDQDQVRQKAHYRPTVTLATLLLAIVLTSFAGSDDCKRLEDGKYEVKFKRFPESNFVVQIDKNQFIKTDKMGYETKGTIEWTGDCHFVLSSDTVTMGNPVLEGIKLGLGNPCYELTKTTGRVTSFILTRSGNLNILIDEGRMKKIN